MIQLFVWPGCVSRALQFIKRRARAWLWLVLDIFRLVDERKQDAQHAVTISVLEVYNNNIRDLLGCVTQEILSLLVSLSSLFVDFVIVPPFIVSNPQWPVF
jgi:hypothetical protein